MKIWSNTICGSDLISPRSNDWLRFKRRDRQSKFVLRSSYRLLICASTDQCWYLYGDGTNQVSILYGCSLLVECGTRFRLIASDGLYVGSVGHVTRANPIRSGYLPTYLVRLVKPFVRHYLIWLNITEGKSAFYRQIPKHHTVEFQLRIIYVRSIPHYEDHLPLISDVVNPLLWGTINPSLWGGASHHYWALWWNVLTNKPHASGHASGSTSGHAPGHVLAHFTWHHVTK